MNIEKIEISRENAVLKKIPNTIHYCWFGGKPKPKNVLEYIANWREALPDYSIVEWNESNFDIASYQYTAEAHRAGKFAFVSDVARLHALHSQGGIYMDTDVEVLRDFAPLLTGDVVLGFEEFNYVATSTMIAPKGSSFIQTFMNTYQPRRFINQDESHDLTTNVEVLTKILVDSGLLRNANIQDLKIGSECVRILDQTKFSPMDYPNGIINADATTFTIHHFGQSWASPSGRVRRSLRMLALTIFGGKNIKSLRNFCAKINK